MNKFVFGALAAAACGSVGFAGNDDGTWSGLDQELRSLATLPAQGGGPDIGALIRSSYASVDSDLMGPSSTTEIGGWVFQDVDIWAEGEVGDFDWRVSFDLDGSSSGGLGSFSGLGLAGVSMGTGGGAALEDAYADWAVADNVAITWGQFKAPKLLTQSVDPENQLFINRSFLGAAFDSWDAGVMAHGDAADFDWWVAIQNGADGIVDEYAITARGQYDINGGAGGMEGSQGSSDDLAATLGIMWCQDDGLGAAATDNTIFGIDGAGSMGAFGGGFEFADLDRDVGDGTPWAIYVSYMLSPDQWEAAVRHEDVELGTTTATRTTLGINWLQAGNNAKIQLNVSNVEIDNTTFDGTVFELGLTVGSSRS